LEEENAKKSNKKYTHRLRIISKKNSNVALSTVKNIMSIKHNLAGCMV